MSVLYPDEFPIDPYVRALRDACPENPSTEDLIHHIKELAPMLEAQGLGLSIWDTTIELYDDPLNTLAIFPDAINRLIITYSKPKSETAHDLICSWCSPRYLEIYRLSPEFVLGSRATASELHKDSAYRQVPRHMLNKAELTDLERTIYECSDHLGHTVNQCLPDCLKLFDLPQGTPTTPVFHGLKIDGDGELFAIRCALLFVSPKIFLAINDRVDNGDELLDSVHEAVRTNDLASLARYIFYLEVDLLPSNLELDFEIIPPEEANDHGDEDPDPNNHIYNYYEEDYGDYEYI